MLRSLILTCYEVSSTRQDLKMVRKYVQKNWEWNCEKLLGTNSCLLFRVQLGDWRFSRQSTTQNSTLHKIWVLSIVELEDESSLELLKKLAKIESCLQFPYGSEKCEKLTSHDCTVALIIKISLRFNTHRTEFA